MGASSAERSELNNLQSGNLLPASLCVFQITSPVCKPRLKTPNNRMKKKTTTVRLRVVMLNIKASKCFCTEYVTAFWMERLFSHNDCLAWHRVKLERTGSDSLQTNSSLLGQCPDGRGGLGRKGWRAGGRGGQRTNAIVLSAACWLFPPLPTLLPPDGSSVLCLCVEEGGFTNDVYAVVLVDICRQNRSPVRDLEWN